MTNTRRRGDSRLNVTVEDDRVGRRRVSVWLNRGRVV